MTAATDRSIIAEMAESLVDHGVDLADERAVILHLKQANYLSGLINQHMDAAIHAARVMYAASTEQALAS